MIYFLVLLLFKVTRATSTTTPMTTNAVCGPCSVVFSTGHALGYGDTQGPTHTMTTMNQWVPSYISNISSLILSGQGCQLQVQTTLGVQSYIYTPGVYECGTLPDGSPSPEECLPTGNDNMVSSIMTCQALTTTLSTTVFKGITTATATMATATTTHVGTTRTIIETTTTTTAPLSPPLTSERIMTGTTSGKTTTLATSTTTTQTTTTSPRVISTISGSLSIDVTNCDDKAGVEADLSIGLAASLKTKTDAVLNCSECTVSVDVNVTLSCPPDMNGARRRLGTASATAAYVVRIIQPAKPQTLQSSEAVAGSDPLVSIRSVADAIESAPIELSPEVQQRTGAVVKAVVVSSVQSLRTDEITTTLGTMTMSIAWATATATGGVRGFSTTTTSTTSAQRNAVTNTNTTTNITVAYLFKAYPNFCVDSTNNNVRATYTAEGNGNRTTCQGLCISNQQCSAIEWYNSWQTCFLILTPVPAVMGSTVAQFQDAQCYIKQVVYPFQNYSNYCVDSSNNSVRATYTEAGNSNLIACQGLCNSNPQCSAIEWYDSKEFCYLVLTSFPAVKGSPGVQFDDARCFVKQSTSTPPPTTTSNQTSAVVSGVSDVVNSEVQKQMQAFMSSQTPTSTVNHPDGFTTLVKMVQNAGNGQMATRIEAMASQQGSLSILFPSVALLVDNASTPVVAVTVFNQPTGGAASIPQPGSAVFTQLQQKATLQAPMVDVTLYGVDGSGTSHERSVKHLPSPVYIQISQSNLDAQCSYLSSDGQFAFDGVAQATPQDVQTVTGGSTSGFWCSTRHLTSFAAIQLATAPASAASTSVGKDEPGISAATVVLIAALCSALFGAAVLTTILAVYCRMKCRRPRSGNMKLKHESGAVHVVTFEVIDGAQTQVPAMEKDERLHVIWQVDPDKVEQLGYAFHSRSSLVYRGTHSTEDKLAVSPSKSQKSLSEEASDVMELYLQREESVVSVESFVDSFPADGEVAVNVDLSPSVKEAYEDGTLVEYYSKSRRRWVGGKIQGGSYADLDATFPCYQVTLSRGIIRRFVEMSAIRLPFQQGDAISYLDSRSQISLDGESRQQRWVDGIVSESAASPGSVLGYKIRLRDFKAKGIVSYQEDSIVAPSNRLRARFAVGDKVEVYQGREKGWVKATVQEPFLRCWPPEPSADNAKETHPTVAVPGFQKAHSRISTPSRFRAHSRSQLHLRRSQTTAEFPYEWTVLAVNLRGTTIEVDSYQVRLDRETASSLMSQSSHLEQL